MLTQYQKKNDLSLSKLLLYSAVIFIFSIIAAFATYLLSQLFYLPLISSFLIALLFLIPLQKWIKRMKFHYAKVSSVIIALACIFTSIALQAIPYYQNKQQFMNDVQTEYQLTKDEANTAFHNTLFKKIGNKGLFGYMKLVAQSGSDFSGYVMINQIPIEFSDFHLGGFGMWLLWILDAGCFLFFLTWGSYSTSNLHFNRHSNQWYDSHRKQIADIDYENKETVLHALTQNQINNIYPYFLSETTIDHPKIEIYEIHNKQNPMEVLLTFIETSVKDGNTIKRNVISLWEIDQNSYQELLLKIPDTKSW